MSERVALVVGGAGAVGGAVARRLASRGARVVVNYFRNVAAGEQVVADIRAAGGEAVPAQANVRNEEDAARAVETGELFFGDINVLVTCACAGPAEVNLGDLSRDELLLRQLNAQLMGTLNVIRIVARGMAARRSGRIVCVTGRHEPHPTLEQLATASNTPTALLARYATLGLTPYTISAYVVAPRSALGAASSGGLAAYARTSDARLATPEDVARTVACIAESEVASAISAELIHA